MADIRTNPTAQDWRSAREYLERVIPESHRTFGLKEWEYAVEQCAKATAALRRSAEWLAAREAPDA